MRKLHAFASLTALAATAGAQQFAPTARLHFPVDVVEADRTTLADLDGDGDLDLIGTMRNGGAQDLVRIYRNDGHGRFVADPRFTPFALQTTHVVADVDGDGDLDVVLRGFVLVNQGPGALQRVQVAINEDPLCAGDLNGDGRADVLTARINYGPGLATTTITAWLAGPGLTFTPVPLLTMPQALAGLALGDFDRDGDLDILVGTSPNWMVGQPYAPGIERILRNDGNGVFTENPAWLPAPADDYTGAVVVADFDGDGWLDCACYCSPPMLMTGWSFRRNDGTGRLLPWNGPVVPVIANGGPPHLCVDLDRDGAPDFVRTGEWWRNDGHGNFQLHVLAGCPGRNLLAAGDVDGDGDLDLVFGGSGANGSAYRLLLDQGGQNFVDATAYAWEPAGYATIVGDVDGDGRPDLLRAGGPLYRNDGSGHFTAEAFPWVGLGQYTHHHFADLDGDGDLDVIYVAFTGANELRFALNDGAGHFTDPAPGIPPLLLGYAATASAAFDADGDGDVDLVIGTSGAGLHLLRSDGALGFTEDPLAFPPFTGDVAVIAAADFDRDGDLDLLVGLQNSTVALHMLLNDGSGHFTEAPARLAAALNLLYTQSISVFDADGDGDLDVLIGNYASSSFDWRHRFLRNDGTGRLVEDPAALPDMRSNQRAAAGDYDGDGHIDILATTLTQGLRLWHNNGQGIFTDVGGIDASDFNYDLQLTLVDLDGDGDADLIAGDRILRSRQWDAIAPFLPQLGRPYVLQFSTVTYGGGTAFPWFATQRARVPLPFGTLGIDLSTAVPMLPTPILGIGTYTVPVPANVGLLGVSFGIQAALVGGPGFHLTPPVYDVVRN